MAPILVRAVQRVLSSAGLRLSRVPPCVEPVMPFDVLELALLKAISDEKQDFYFVQVGANDGLMNGSLNPLIRKYGLRGCLVEPMPAVFNMLKHNYRDQPQLDFRNVMIGERDGDAPIHRLKRDDPVPYEFFHGLARQDTDYSHKRAKSAGLENYIDTVHCRMVTFESLMADLPVCHVSMLYVGTEGTDDQIVDAAFGADVFPPIINYECTEMPLERRCNLKMRLLDHGYRFIDVGADTVCLRVEK
jgi:FkbM family methyltransferase